MFYEYGSNFESLHYNVEVTSFSVAICMNKTKILGGQLNCSVKLAEKLVLL